MTTRTIADKHEFTIAELVCEFDTGASAIYWYDRIEYETEDTWPLTADVPEDTEERK